MTHRPDRIVIYRDTGQRWRWRRVAPNGRIVSSSGEAFASRLNAHRAALREATPTTFTLTYAP